MLGRIFAAWGLVAMALLASTTHAADTQGSGIEWSNVDRSIRPQDDFYRYVNGRWLARTTIPADKSSYGSDDELQENIYAQLRAIVASLQAHADPADPDQQKIADLYADFMDEAAIKRAGLAPLAQELQRIEHIRDRRELGLLISHFNALGIPAPFSFSVDRDARDATRNVLTLNQDGLGLPDRDYYLLDDSALVGARQAYQEYLEGLLRLGGDAEASAHAQEVLALETALARAQWTRVDSRDAVKTDNPRTLAQLAALAPGMDWPRLLAEAGTAPMLGTVVVAQPSYLAALDGILATHSLPVWQAYFRAHLLGDMAPYLGKAWVDRQFAFTGTVLRGIPENQVRWQRGLDLLDSAIGEGLGKLYVARHFPSASRERMNQMVGNLLAAFAADIDTLDWMGPETRARARAKLARLTVKIGYPARWRNYDALRIVRGELVANVLRARRFEWARKVGKLGLAVDRDEWTMTPMTINAYSDSTLNEIVFPAAVLQPPYFDPQADEAVNYGSIGGVIGHEISHGFDDQGSLHDPEGRLLGSPGWFTQEDYARFAARTQMLVTQYNALEALPGYPVNGALTLGENIADNSGLAVAYQAYLRSLKGEPAPVIDGLSGAQRLFMGWSQLRREKVRRDELILGIKTDPHAPDEIRATQPLRNQPAFFEAFGIKPGDPMYLAPEQRFRLW